MIWWVLAGTVVLLVLPYAAAWWLGYLSRRINGDPAEPLPEDLAELLWTSPVEVAHFHEDWPDCPSCAGEP